MDIEPRITNLIRDWQQGDDQAGDQLYQHILPVLRRQVRLQRNAQSPQIRLDTNELISEAYLKLHGSRNLSVNDRAHFFAISARAIRYLIVDHIKKAAAQKRGGLTPLISIEDVDEQAIQGTAASVDWLAVDQAIARLEEADPASARVVEMKFFSSMTLAEMAQASRCSVMTIRRKWRFAKAFLSDHFRDLAS